MSGSTRRKLRSEISRPHNLDDADEGTAARTRPLSYDEIMLKRKSKKECEGFEAREAESTRREETVTNLGHHSRDSHPSAVKNSREDNSRKKEQKTSRVENTSGKSKNKESRDLESRSKHKHDKDVRSSTDAIKGDSRGHGRSKLDEYSRDIGRYDYEKKHHRDSVAQDRYVDRSRGAHERENKRKDRSGEDDKYRTKDSVKKHDSGARRESEFSERKEKMESSNSRYDETRSKRRRSKSQDHVKEKDRRSRSSSPKTRKNVSTHGHDRGELSLQSQRDKSRNHSDIDRNKMSSNGSASHQRRHGGSSSGLGGYSPRKRKTEAAVKTPSPPIRSPERKSAGWDLHPAGADGKLSGSVASGPQLLSQIKSSNMIELAAGISVAASMGKPLSAIMSTAFKDTTVDSVQLTQATRPMRRLYIDNIPASASEKDVMEYFNSFLLSSGANHIRGTRPCISCMINKEKRQALVEFLTPEDASAALYFDGRSLSGSIIKVRRPKDFVEVASGSAEISKQSGSVEISKQSGSAERRNSKSESHAISDVVKESQHKIFIGGIAAGLSSEMIMEIVSAFGPLKAYRFENNEDLTEPCAFLEYADQSVTLKACAGLNGMKLGGRVLTVAQAVPDTSSLENSGSRQLYGIPEHVKPLLEVPTPVLKLSNVLDRNALKLLSETDLEEIVEDVRLECSRFGSVISINVVKTGNVCADISETKEVNDDKRPFLPQEEKESMECLLNVESVEGTVNHDDGVCKEVEPLSSVEELNTGDSVKEGDEHDLAPVTATASVEVGAAKLSTVQQTKEADKNVPQDCDNVRAANHPQELAVIDCSAVDEDARTDISDVNHQEVPIWEGEVECELYPSENMDTEKSGDREILSAADVPELDKSCEKLQEAVPVANDSATTDLGATENFVKNENAGDIGTVFEVGSVLVEFRRTEASCMAAHCLHRRVFDDRIVTVEYVALDAYRTKFPK